MTVPPTPAAAQARVTLRNQRVVDQVLDRAGDAIGGQLGANRLHHPCGAGEDRGRERFRFDDPGDCRRIEEIAAGDGDDAFALPPGWHRDLQD